MENRSVSVWEEEVVIPTYPVGKPNKNPMFLEKRVIRGNMSILYLRNICGKRSLA